jgi:hypothetical protein
MTDMSIRTSPGPAGVPCWTDLTVADGGAVLKRDLDTPYGRMAGLADPAGAVSWVAQTDENNRPDRTG